MHQLIFEYNIYILCYIKIFFNKNHAVLQNLFWIIWRNWINGWRHTHTWLKPWKMKLDKSMWKITCLCICSSIVGYDRTFGFCRRWNLHLLQNVRLLQKVLNCRTFCRRFCRSFESTFTFCRRWYFEQNIPIFSIIFVRYFWHFSHLVFSN